IDLGSGGGELSRHLARHVPDAEVTGLEMSRWPYERARLFGKFFGPKNVRYLRQDFFTYDCGQAGAVYFYLDVGLAPRVGEKLRRELKPGALVISHSFPLKGEWGEPGRVDFHAPFKETLLVYRR